MTDVPMQRAGVVALLTILIFALFTTFPQVANGEQSGDFSYDLIDGTSVEIIRYWGSNEEVVVPDSIDGLPVTSLDVITFNDREFVSSISLGKNMSSIDIGTFLPCSALNEIMVDDGNTHLTSIEGILYDRYITNLISCPAMKEGSIVVPNSVSRIEESAFQSCSYLASVTLGDGLRSIGPKAFYGCDSLMSIDIPDHINEWGWDTFCYSVSLKKVHLPSTLNYIPDRAFQGCKALSNINVSENFMYIGSGAFADCDSLSMVTVPDTVSELGREIFSSCDNLTVATFNGRVIGEMAFANCPRLRTLNLSPNLQQVQSYAFSGCVELTSVILPEGVISLGTGAFLMCSKLSSIVLSEGLTSIPGSCFSQCTSLSKVTISENVTSIGTYAFSGCRSLRSVNIPANVTEIGMFAFNQCERLDGLYFQGDAPLCDIGWVDGTDPQLTIYHYDIATGFEGPEWERMRMSTIASDSNSNTGGNPFDTPMILAVLGLVAVIGVVAFVIIRKRRK